VYVYAFTCVACNRICSVYTRINVSVCVLAFRGHIYQPSLLYFSDARMSCVGAGKREF